MPKLKTFNLKREALRFRRTHRVRSRFSGTSAQPRLAVFRSLKHISAQVIDDALGRTLAMASDKDVDQALKGKERAAAVGALVATRAKEKGVTAIVFDRRRYRYHGRVQALAEAARAGGLTF
ncbi:MAG: 50S ribosomal protein L18 [Patescibacteria group bacterium]|jgi:large subunit ribosomal protein L18